MSMSHKAYEFDWTLFSSELLPIMISALSSGKSAELVHWIETNRDSCRDPDTGDPLSADWKLLHEASDVQVFADLAITKYYDPSQDFGLAEDWLKLSEQLPPSASRALLGKQVSPTVTFDPGKMGSYFQDPVAVDESLSILNSFMIEELLAFKSLLQKAAQNHKGIYVTF